MFVLFSGPQSRGPWVGGCQPPLIILDATLLGVSLYVLPTWGAQVVVFQTPVEVLGLQCAMTDTTQYLGALWMFTWTFPPVVSAIGTSVLMLRCRLHGYISMSYILSSAGALALAVRGLLCWCG